MTIGEFNSLENSFGREMYSLYMKVRDRYGFDSSKYMNMVLHEGGVTAAKKLINSPEDDNFQKTRNSGCTAEALALRDEYQCLFTEEELQICRQRLGQA